MKRGRGDREDGSIAPMVAVLGLVFLLLIGLVIDSSRQLDARARAVSYAQEAARAGAEAVNPDSTQLVVPEAAALARVDNYCAAARAGEPHLVECRLVAVNGNQVTTEARISLPAGLLGIIGTTTLNASGSGSAHPEIGTTAGDAQ